VSTASDEFCVDAGNASAADATATAIRSVVCENTSAVIGRDQESKRFANEDQLPVSHVEGKSWRTEAKWSALAWK
jgi:hypothetical protein